MKSQSSDHPVTEKNDPGEGERDSSARADSAPGSPDIDEIVALARRYYAAGFPNPQRRGCPPSGEIVKVVSGRRAPGQGLREHLFECSQCFGEYRQALAQIRNEVVGWKQLILILSLKRVSIPAVILLSLAFAGIVIWRKPTPESHNEQITRSNPSGADMASPVATPNKTDAPLTVGPKPAEIAKPRVNRRVSDGISRSPGNPEPVAETFEVDLDNYQLLRRSQEEKRSIELHAVRGKLLLRLPETGAAGKYTVSLIDAFGRDLVSMPAVSHDGDNLQVILDLRRITPKKYRLRLSRKGEAPAYYDVIVRRR